VLSIVLLRVQTVLQLQLHGRVKQNKRATLVTPPPLAPIMQMSHRSLPKPTSKTNAGTGDTQSLRCVGFLRAAVIRGYIRLALQICSFLGMRSLRQACF
jgi:hypothetical protein